MARCFADQADRVVLHAELDKSSKEYVKRAAGEGKPGLLEGSPVGVEQLLVSGLVQHGTKVFVILEHRPLVSEFLHVLQHLKHPILCTPLFRFP